MTSAGNASAFIVLWVGMAVLQFGDSDSALVGVFSPPEGGLDRSHGVVMCPPIGQEHIRTHWAYRQVIAALNRAGFSCFRFDWFGVGDSAGELRGATVLRWKEDLAGAVQELRDTSGVSQISLVGLRLGATLAAVAAEAVMPSALVLWDPVVRGLDYIAALRAMTKQLLGDRLRFWNVDPNRRIRPGELVGFDFGEQLLGEIEQLDLRTHRMPDVPICVVDSSGDPTIGSFGNELAANRRDVEVHQTELRTRWSATEDIEQLLLPGDALRVVTAFLEAR